MIKNIYVFRDVLSGSYEYFGNFVNDSVAMREFKHACSDANVPADDLELYCASEIDTNTGRIRAVSDDMNPVFVCKGERNVEN